MKLIEALNQERPIRKKGWELWCKPEIIQPLGGNIALVPIDMTAEYAVYASDFAHNSWEVLEAPIRFTFTSTFRLDGIGHRVSVIPLPSVLASGNRFKITFEEVQT